jgi:hypothetical protein
LPNGQAFEGLAEWDDGGLDIVGHQFEHALKVVAAKAAIYVAGQLCIRMSGHCLSPCVSGCWNFSHHRGNGQAAHGGKYEGFE